MLSTVITPRFLETDALGHINNTVLPMWFEAARDPIFRMFTPEMDVNDWKLILASYSVSFHAETHYGDDVEIRSYISRFGNSSFDVHQECWQQGIKTVTGVTTMVHFSHDTKKSLPIPPAVLEQLQQHQLPSE